MGADSAGTGTAGGPSRPSAREAKWQVNRPLQIVTGGFPQGLNRSQRLGLRVAGSGLLTASAAIHLDLYLTGYPQAEPLRPVQPPRGPTGDHRQWPVYLPLRFTCRVAGRTADRTSARAVSTHGRLRQGMRRARVSWSFRT